MIVDIILFLIIIYLYLKLKKLEDKLRKLKEDYEGHARVMVKKVSDLEQDIEHIKFNIHYIEQDLDKVMKYLKKED